MGVAVVGMGETTEVRLLVGGTTEGVAAETLVGVAVIMVGGVAPHHPQWRVKVTGCAPTATPAYLDPRTNATNAALPSPAVAAVGAMEVILQLPFPATGS